ncbi:MAG TPA: GntR family transcriptional regulator, partial [Alphaproteobacteria bacterium]|nr:GntR family transcriptional regulator [Alphaproteobacteria bacterium]
AGAHGPSSVDRMFAKLIAGIQAGRYVPGQRLIEGDLTAEFGLSRGTVREALARLAAEGLIELVPHRGAYIRILTRQDVHDMLLVVERLASLAAYLAAKAIDKRPNRVAFEDAYARVRALQAHPEGLGAVQARTKFYEVLMAASGNRELARTMPLMHVHLLRMQFHQFMRPKDRQAQFAEYDALARNILAGSPERAEAAMRRHIQRTRRRLERLPDEFFPMPR